MFFRLTKFFGIDFPLKTYYFRSYSKLKIETKSNIKLIYKDAAKRFLATSSGDTKKFNYHIDCEKYVNKQINLELYASYAYLTMAYHFDRHTIALPGFFNMFLFFSKEETEHAMFLMEFQNKRGGHLCYENVNKLEPCDWEPLSAVEKAIELEETSLIKLHEIGSKHKDANLCDFIETVYLQEQYDAIKSLRDLEARIKSVGSGLGEHILDQELFNKYLKKNNDLKIKHE